MALLKHYLGVHFGFHSILKVRLEPDVVLPQFLGAVPQGQGPQHGDAGVHHVHLAKGVHRHLGAPIPDDPTLWVVQGAVLALPGAQGPVAPGGRKSCLSVSGLDLVPPG